MKRDPVATFVVERVPGKGYQVIERSGPRAEKLQRLALESLDQTGRLAPAGPPRVDVWLGPLGNKGHFVRMSIERTSAGEARYHQAWYSRWRLPQHPATVELSSLPHRRDNRSASPAIGREFRPDRAILAAIQAAAASGRAQTIAVADHAAALSCAAMITLRCGGRDARRLTWITHSVEGVPVHLRMQQQTSLGNEPPPTADPAEATIDHVTPVLPARFSPWRAKVPLPLAATTVLAAALGSAALAWSLAREPNQSQGEEPPNARSQGAATADGAR